jgi:hypothetical protein
VVWRHRRRSEDILRLASRKDRSLDPLGENKRHHTARLARVLEARKRDLIYHTHNVSMLLQGATRRSEIQPMCYEVWGVGRTILTFQSRFRPLDAAGEGNRSVAIETPDLYDSSIGSLPDVKSEFGLHRLSKSTRRQWRDSTANETRRSVDGDVR